MKCEDARLKLCPFIRDIGRCKADKCMGWESVYKMEFDDIKIDDEIPEGWREFSGMAFDHRSPTIRVYRNIETHEGDCKLNRGNGLATLAKY